MLLFNNQSRFFIFTILLLYSYSTKSMSTSSWDKYIITSTQNKQSKHWANYLYQKLSYRTDSDNLVNLNQFNNQKKNSKKHRIIFISVSENSKYDYCVKIEQNSFHLILKADKASNLKIINQLLEKIAFEDSRFKTTDLPPNTLQFKEGCHNFDFEYREPFFAPNLKPGNNELFGTNSIDVDWGIWGHNLKRLVVNKNDSTSYALIDGKRNNHQLCFSSVELFNNISEYIVDNFGDGEKQSHHFMISPQDNNLVCQDKGCVRLGNTKTNATPAVADMLEKLAKRFPKHQFFTIAYLTTQSAPKNRLAKNSGVLLSTIDLPKGVELNRDQPKTQKFIKILDEWKSKTSKVYTWDYASNFDDYLTPIPVLTGLQKQLQFYKEHNIKGVFLNASGYDYSSFDGLKTYISASLMFDSKQSITPLIQRYFQAYYPENHKLLSNYYLKLESDFTKKLKPYPLYGGIVEISNTYLDESNFIDFYNKLEKAISKTEGIEKERLHKLFTALSFTRLQIAYRNGANPRGFADKKSKTLIVKPNINTWISHLEQVSIYDNLNQYRESSSDLTEYIENWKNVISNKEFTNLLIDTPLTLLSKPDEGIENTRILNDGILGFAPDYHQGWYISSTDLKIGVSFPEAIGQRKVKLRFLTYEPHGFYPPEKIEVKENGQLLKTILADEFKKTDYIAYCSFNLNIREGADIEFHFIKKEGVKVNIACDEIQIN